MRRMGDLRTRWWLPSLLVALLTLVASSGQAAPNRSAACPPPKPLPANTKKPPGGATATQLANFLLALPQRKPCDIGLFTSQFQPGPWPGLYPDGPPMEPLPRTTPAEAQAHAQLTSFLAGSPAQAAALALFGRADVKAKMPDPTLRAALAALTGTAGEPAIEHFLRSPAYLEPRFGGLGVQQLGRASVRYSDRKIEIILNVRHQPEHPALLSSTVMHEILHHDPVAAGYPEEIILNWIAAAVHMQQLNRRPRLATSGTELSRFMNEWPLLLTNSRAPASSRIATVVPRGKGVAPGSPQNVRDFWTFMHKVYEKNPTSRAETAPAPPALRAILANLLAPRTAPKTPNFSMKTAQLFSKMNDAWLSPVDRLRISVLLGVLSVEEITAYTGLSRAKTIATFRLSPILAAMS
jgi:hypothetical protein